MFATHSRSVARVRQFVNTLVALGIRNSEGSVTAEFAAIVPAVILVLAVSLSGLHMATQQLQLNEAAASIARSAARGSESLTLAATLVPGATSLLERHGNLICSRVELETQPFSALFGTMTLTATSCALEAGH